MNLCIFFHSETHGSLIFHICPRGAFHHIPNIQHLNPISKEIQNYFNFPADTIPGSIANEEGFSGLLQFEEDRQDSTVHRCAPHALCNSSENLLSRPMTPA